MSDQPKGTKMTTTQKWNGFGVIDGEATDPAERAVSKTELLNQAPQIFARAKSKGLISVRLPEPVNRCTRCHRPSERAICFDCLALSERKEQQLGASCAAKVLGLVSAAFSVREAAI